MTARPGFPLAEIVLLCIWLGSAGLFAAVVAPAAFAVLPTRTLAGALVGRVLPVIFYSGAAAGVLLVLLELASRSAARGRLVAGVVMAAACLVAQLFVVARIDRLRAAIPGAIESLATDDPRRVAFGRLHAVSVGWLGLAILAALAALWLAVRVSVPRG